MVSSYGLSSPPQAQEQEPWSEPAQTQPINLEFWFVVILLDHAALWHVQLVNPVVIAFINCIRTFPFWLEFLAMLFHQPAAYKHYQIASLKNKCPFVLIVPSFPSLLQHLIIIQGNPPCFVKLFQHVDSSCMWFSIFQIVMNSCMQRREL